MTDTTAARKVPSKSYGWVVLLVVFFAGTTAPVNMAKPIAIAPVVMEMFGVGQDVFGWIVSCFYILGFIVAFPAAGIVSKFGVKKTIITCLAVGFLGSALGALAIPPTAVADIAATGHSSGNLGLFIGGRILEGMGMGLLGVTGPTAIAPWFPKEKRGFPLALWSVWVSFAMAIFQPVYGMLIGGATDIGTGIYYPAGDPANIWWLACIYTAVIAVVFIALYKDAPKGYAGDDFETENEEAPAGGGVKKSLIGTVLKNPAVVLLAVIFLVDEFAFMAGNGVFMSYLTGGGDIPSPWAEAPLDLGQATLLGSFATILGVVLSPLIGFTSDKLKSRKKILIPGLIIGVVFCALTFNVGPVPIEGFPVLGYVGVLVLGSLTGGMVPFAIWSSMPELVTRDYVPAANGVISFSQNLGMSFGGIVLGAVLATTQSWSFTAYSVMLPCYIICIIVFVAGGLWKKMR